MTLTNIEDIICQVEKTEFSLLPSSEEDDELSDVLQYLNTFVQECEGRLGTLPEERDLAHVPDCGVATKTRDTSDHFRSGIDALNLHERQRQVRGNSDDADEVKGTETQAREDSNDRAKETNTTSTEGRTIHGGEGLAGGGDCTDEVGEKHDVMRTMVETERKLPAFSGYTHTHEKADSSYQFTGDPVAQADVGVDPDRNFMENLITMMTELEGKFTKDAEARGETTASTLPPSPSTTPYPNTPTSPTSPLTLRPPTSPITPLTPQFHSKPHISIPSSPPPFKPPRASDSFQTPTVLTSSGESLPESSVSSSSSSLHPRLPHSPNGQEKRDQHFFTALKEGVKHMTWRGSLRRKKGKAHMAISSPQDFRLLTATTSIRPDADPIIKTAHNAD